VLCLAIGLDIARSPEREKWTGFSLVDAVSAATKPGMSVVGLIGSDYEQLDEPVSRDAELTEAQVEGMVRYAVAMAGGLRQRLDPDAEWVVIKPNIVELKTRGSGVITDWRVVKALIKMVHEIVPEARITIAEGPAEWIPPGSPEVRVMAEIADGFEIAGYRPLLQDEDLAGVDLDILDLNFDEIAEVEVPDGGYAQDRWTLPNAILESDFLISVPVLKIHDVIGMTNVMKNFVGIAPGMVYGWPKMVGHPPRSGNPGIPHTDSILDETIVDLVASAEVDFAVVDAIMCMERDKTDRFDGRQVRMNTIIASADIVAADAVSAQLIGLNPFDIEYLTLAAYKGLGQCDPGNIKVKGSAMEQVAVRFEKCPADRGRGGEMGHYGQGCRTWLLKGPFDRSQAKGEEEFLDAQNPGAVPGQNGWSAPVYFHDDRIDLDKYYDDPFDCVVYAYAEFDAPEEQDAELWAGSDEGLRVWLNGEMVYEHEGRRRHRLPSDREQIRVQEGRNTVLVRADQSRSRYDFSLNVCEVESDPRYDGNRVWGLKFSVPAGPTPAGAKVAELAVSRGDDAIPADARLLDGVRMERYRDSLIGALEGCLRFLGEEPSPARLRGVTGHAFRLCVADSLDWDGPVRVDLPTMVDLYAHLGYRIRVISAAADAPDFTAQQQEAWEAIRASIDRKVPVIADLGWSYRLVHGYHPRKEQYYTAGSRWGPRQVELDELGVSERGEGGLNVLLLEERQPVDPRAAERRSLRFAVAEARRQDEPGSPFHHGFSGFEHWIADFEAGRIDGRFGPALTAGIVAEARTFAGEYLREIAPHYPGGVAARLREAGEHYDKEVAYLDKVAELIPYRGIPQVDLEDPQAREEIGELLRQAYAWERKAIESIESALAMMPSSN